MATRLALVDDDQNILTSVALALGDVRFVDAHNSTSSSKFGFTGEEDNVI